MADHQSLRGRAFVAVGMLCRHLPQIRGRTRLFLSFYGLLGLRSHHVKARTTLDDPITFIAELDLHSWLQRIAFLTGGYEGDLVRFLLRLHQSRGCKGYLLDVGANIGLISIPFALSSLKDGDNTRANKLVAIAVEAVPDNYRALSTNVALNDLGSNMHIIQTALGETAKTVEIQVEGDLKAGQGTGTANILPTGSTYQCVKQALELKRLDDLEFPAGCSVMKIDTDGYDLKVLQGATKFLKSNRPVIFGEFAAHCMGWHNQSLSDVKTFATANGYCTWEKLHGTWKFTETPHLKTFSQDLLLIPEELVKQYSWCVESSYATV